MTQTDLFTHKTAKQKLYDFIRQKRYVRTSEIIRFALDNFSNRGDRNARQLAREGRIRRMPHNKKIRLFGNIAEDVWEICDWHNQFRI